MNAVTECPHQTAAVTDTESNGITMSREDAETILELLLVGLDSFGEIERLDDTFGAYVDAQMQVPAALKPLHPTGCNDTIGRFATALRIIAGSINNN